MSNVSIVEGVAKASGNPYKALQIKVGDYETRIFPSKVELLYIESELAKEAAPAKAAAK